MATKPTNPQTPASSTPVSIASVELTVLRKHKGSIRFDADTQTKAKDPIADQLYLDKFAMSQNFTAPKAGMIPGKVKVSIEVLDWVDTQTVPTAEEFAERKAAKAAQKS
jgi:hypothetical protein